MKLQLLLVKRGVPIIFWQMGSKGRRTFGGSLFVCRREKGEERRRKRGIQYRTCIYTHTHTHTRNTNNLRMNGNKNNLRMNGNKKDIDQKKVKQNREFKRGGSEDTMERRDGGREGGGASQGQRKAHSKQ